MPRRTRTGKNDPSIPKPPSRKDFEQQSADHIPKPDQRLLEYHGRPRPPGERETSARPLPEEPATPAVREILVPMVCAVKKTPFVVRFTENAPNGWRFSTTLLVKEIGGSAGAKLDQVPVNEMQWLGALCPACNAKCAPIWCGACRQFVCDGGVSVLPSSERFQRCACGSMGVITPTLKAVSAAKGADAREPGRASSSSPARPLMLRFRGE